LKESNLKLDQQGFYGYESDSEYVYVLDGDIEGAFYRKNP